MYTSVKFKLHVELIKLLTVLKGKLYGILLCV
jgi:hypothetical protein